MTKPVMQRPKTVPGNFPHDRFSLSTTDKLGSGSRKPPEQTVKHLASFQFDDERPGNETSDPGLSLGGFLCVCVLCFGRSTSTDQLPSLGAIIPRYIDLHSASPRRT